ncbi:MAG TPA: hypothetical protein VJB87_00425 [Candidatus Nanoarchaeia archaeon]|nr:hypothetical protein [Candidatus Nanoarchaeia archaeon]
MAGSTGTEDIGGDFPISRARSTCRVVPDPAALTMERLERAVAKFDLPALLASIDSVVHEMNVTYSKSPDAVVIDTGYDHEHPTFRVPVREKWVASIAFAVPMHIHLKGHLVDYTFIPETPAEVGLMSGLEEALRYVAVGRGVRGVLLPSYHPLRKKGATHS